MKAFKKFLRRLFSDKRKEKMRVEWQNHLNLLIEKEMEEERRLEEKKVKFKALCEFFERRGYEFYTRTPMVKMGGIYQIYGSLCHRRRTGRGRGRWPECILHCDGNKLPLQGGKKNSPFEGYN